MSYPTIAHQHGEHYDETIKLEAEINLNSDSEAHQKSARNKLKHCLNRLPVINLSFLLSRYSFPQFSSYWDDLSPMLFQQSLKTLYKKVQILRIFLECNII